VSDNKKINKKYFTDKRVSAYLRPRYVRMVEGMAYETATSKSDIAVMAIEGMFNNMPQERQEKYAKSSEKYHKSKKDQL
jgi:hypothetical protein